MKTNNDLYDIINQNTLKINVMSIQASNQTAPTKLDQYFIDQRNQQIAWFKEVVSEKAFDRVMNVIKTLEAKGVKTEISVHKSGDVSIGFKKGKFVYDWYLVNDFKGVVEDYRGYLQFNHSYSQNTGKSEKGLRWGMQTTEAYKKRFGVELNTVETY